MKLRDALKNNVVTLSTVKSRNHVIPRFYRGKILEQLVDCVDINITQYLLQFAETKYWKRKFCNIF